MKIDWCGRVGIRTRLRSIGATVVAPPNDSPWGRRAVVDDFDGHRVELTEKAAAVPPGTPR